MTTTPQSSARTAGEVCHLCDGNGYKQSRTGSIYCEACNRTGVMPTPRPATLGKGETPCKPD